MSNQTIKQPNGLDSAQTLKESYNQVNATLSVDGFLTAVVGRRVDLAISSTNVANDTETYSFSELSVPLYTYQVTYTDGTRTTLLFAERIA
jgi:hypothetical protein